MTRAFQSTLFQNLGGGGHVRSMSIKHGGGGGAGRKSLCLIGFLESEPGDGTRSGQNWSNFKEGLRKESPTIKRLKPAAKLKSFVVWNKLFVGSQEGECRKYIDILGTFIITPITCVHVSMCNAGYL